MRKGRSVGMASIALRSLLYTSFVLMVALVGCILPTVVRAAEQPATTISVQNIDAAPGDTVTMAVTVRNNPGILGAVLQITYDEGLTLKSATNGDAFAKLSMTKPGSLTSPCRFSWDGIEINPSDVKDGEILVLNFEVSDGIEPGRKLAVNVTGNEGAVLDGDLNSVSVAYVSGAVTVSDYTPGDLDGDKVVNSRDVILARRHIVGGYQQEINIPAADVNDDLLVSSADVILMRRFIAGGYGVELKRSRLRPDGSQPDSSPEHVHSLEAVAAKDPTCTEPGNIAYWHCGACDKYFSDATALLEISQADTVSAATGHVLVDDPYVAPTPTSPGLTKGSHCSVCGEVIEAQREIPPLESDEHYISYDVANGDPYLAGIEIANPNKTSYFEGDSFKLANLSVSGYRFLGWYDGAGDDATKITRIDATSDEDYELYAHWQLVPYTVQYESDLYLETESATYTVDKGLSLPAPRLSNYIFVGWSDESSDSNEMYGKRVPVGTTGNITLTANWTSERNKATTNPNPSDPVLYEDDNVLLFAYEIGRIENVPRYAINDFGYISGDGVTKSETTAYSEQTSTSLMESLANTVADATTKSSNWTLSSNWNETTSISEEWCQQHGYSREEAETICRSDSQNWNVSNSAGGTNSTTNYGQTSDGWVNELKFNGSDSQSSTTGQKTAGEVNASVEAGMSVPGYNLKANLGTKLSDERSKEHTDSSSSGFEAGGSQTHSQIGGSDTTNTSSWNSSASYGGSSTTSRSNSVATTLSEMISQKYGYGKSYCVGTGESQGVATSSTVSSSDTYQSAVTYNTSTADTITSSWTTAATKPGYHRWIVAGTAHVFGVVGYDIKTKSYFTYTYSMMDDETHEFEDYSYVSAHYDDHENGVITFEVPYEEVVERVADRVFASDGLKVDLQTGVVTSYEGADSLVVIPEYYNAGQGDVVKITGISSNAFAGNENINTVILSDYVTEIPDNAFKDCTSLAYVRGAGVTSIGDNAFAGCSAMEECGVFSSVTHLGNNAFGGAEYLYVNASSQDVVAAAANAGASNVSLNLRLLDESNEDVLKGTTINVPDTVARFDVDGDFHRFNGLKIESRANETLLNKINIAGDTSLPVKLYSNKITLNQSSISSPGIALALMNNSSEVGLRGTTTIDSSGPNAMLSKNLSLYETANDVVGKLSVLKKLLVCGAISGGNLLDCNQVEIIDQATFDALLNPCMITFNTAGGTCSETSREIANGMPIGALPTPTKDYHSFDGWYFDGTGEKVTASTILPVASAHTLVAHWTENPVSGWVKKSEMPADGQVVNTKWTYKLNVYRQDPSTYTYYRYCSFYDGIVNQDSCWINGGSVYHEITVGSPLPSQANRFPDMGGNSAGICGPYATCEHKGEGQSFWWLKRINYVTVLDRVENKESTTQPTGGNITDVVEWVQYRPKTLANSSGLSGQSVEGVQSDGVDAPVAEELSPMAPSTVGSGEAAENAGLLSGASATQTPSADQSQRQDVMGEMPMGSEG